MTKMRASPQPALPAAPGKFAYAAIFVPILVVAALAVLIFQSGAIGTLSRSGLLP